VLPQAKRDEPVKKTPIVAVTATTKTVAGQEKVQVNSAYTAAIRAAGLIPLVIPPVGEEDVPAILDAVQGLVLTGGEDLDPAHFRAARHPATGPANDPRDRCELALAREAAARRLPTLAICRGVQVLNVALGGTLVQDIPTELDEAIEHDAESARSSRVHDVSIDPGSRLESIVVVGRSAITANSFHHQSVDQLAPGLMKVAASSDGVIEGVECADRAWWAVGVQWHPEELTGTVEDWDRRLFEAFANAVRKNEPLSP
jgi:putative glutamine amidotransferase